MTVSGSLQLHNNVRCCRDERAEAALPSAPRGRRLHDPEWDIVWPSWETANRCLGRRDGNVQEKSDQTVGEQTGWKVIREGACSTCSQRQEQRAKPGSRVISYRGELQSWCHFLGLPQSFPVKYLQALKLQLLRSAGPLCAPAAGRDVISQIWGRCGISVTNTAKGEGFPQSRFSVRAVS